MPLQYLHTSSRRGLEPGKSGFCCVARDRDLPPDLAKELERLSRYEHFPDRENPWIARHLHISLRSGNYHVLSRLIDAGTDYSKRNNHIAHHLSFTEEEVVRLPDPATIILFWRGWRGSWKEPPRILNEQDAFSIKNLDTESTPLSDAFPTAIERGRPIEKPYTIKVGWERELALHYRNELLKLPAESRWNVVFTSFILTSDRPADFLWRGNWENRSLPFEFESVQSPLIERTTTTFKKPKTDSVEDGSPSGPDAKPVVRSAPKVEIPEELRSEDRKRPKRKWTRKRLKRTLNLSLVVLALLCGGIASYLLLGLNHSETNPDSASIAIGVAPFPTSQNNPIQNDARSRWQGFLDSGSLYRNLEEVLEISEFLAQAGDKEPLLIVESLVAIKRSIEEIEPLIALPKGIVDSNEFQYELNSTLVSMMPAFQGALIPESLTDIVSTPADEHSPLEPLIQRLLPDRFIPEDIIQGIKSSRRHVRDQLAQQGLGAVSAAEEFQNQASQLAQDELATNIQALESAFGINSSNGFLTMNSSGVLATPHETDIKNHLQSLYETYMLPRASSMGSSPEFRLALAKASQYHESVIIATRAINDVFEKADPFSEGDRAQLQRIQNLWRATFLRGDLMKETIINFNLERLANSKRSLARLQSEFPPKTLRELDKAQRLNTAIDTAESALLEIDTQTQWVLMYLDAKER